MSGAAGNLPLPDIQARTNDEVLLLHILKRLGGLTGSDAGLATEATQLNVLSTLTDILGEQQIEFSVKCIEDANGDIYLLRIRWDEDAGGGYTYDYIDAAGNVVVPVAPLKICDPSALLNAIVTELQTLNSTDFATETTLAAIQTLLTGTSKTINTIQATTNGSTTAGVKSVSLFFRGNGGTLDGMPVPNQYIANFEVTKPEDILPAIPYTVPTSGLSEILITEIV